MCRTQTSQPWGLKTLGCSVVLQTRWRMVVLPALARPTIRTRKRPALLRKFSARILCLSSGAWDGVRVLDNGSNGDERAPSISTLDWLISWSGAGDGVRVLDNESGGDQRVPSISTLDWHTSWFDPWDGARVLDNGTRRDERVPSNSVFSAVWVLVFQKRNFLSTSLDILFSYGGGGSEKEQREAIYCLACSA